MSFLEVYEFLKENNISKEEMDVITNKVRKVNTKLDKILKDTNKHWSELNIFLLKSILKEYEEKCYFYFFIIGNFYKEKPIGCCTIKGIEDINYEEPNSTFVKCTKEEYTNYTKNKILPVGWEKRTLLSFEDIKNDEMKN